MSCEIFLAQTHFLDIVFSFYLHGTKCSECESVIQHFAWNSSDITICTSFSISISTSSNISLMHQVEVTVIQYFAWNLNCGRHIIFQKINKICKRQNWKMTRISRKYPHKILKRGYILNHTEYRFNVILFIAQRLKVTEFNMCHVQTHFIHFLLWMICWIWHFLTQFSVSVRYFETRTRQGKTLLWVDNADVHQLLKVSFQCFVWELGGVEMKIDPRHLDWLS